MSPGLAAILADLAERNRRYHIVDLGLRTQANWDRYLFWQVMRNAAPSHFRWDYHPGVIYGLQSPEPWT